MNQSSYNYFTNYQDNSGMYKFENLMNTTKNFMNSTKVNYNFKNIYNTPKKSNYTTQSPIIKSPKASPYIDVQASSDYFENKIKLKNLRKKSKSGVFGKFNVIESKR